MQIQQPLESDWKTFRKLVPECRERYLCEVNRRIAEMLSQDENAESPTERFWKIEEEVARQTKILRDCLDGHRRSSLGLSAALMYRHKMLSDDELAMFSAEFAERVKGIFRE